MGWSGYVTIDLQGPHIETGHLSPPAEAEWSKVQILQILGNSTWLFFGTLWYAMCKCFTNLYSKLIYLPWWRFGYYFSFYLLIAMKKWAMKQSANHLHILQVGRPMWADHDVSVYIVSNYWLIMISVLARELWIY